MFSVLARDRSVVARHSSSIVATAPRKSKEQLGPGRLNGRETGQIKLILNQRSLQSTKRGFLKTVFQSIPRRKCVASSLQPCCPARPPSALALAFHSKPLAGRLSHNAHVSIHLCLRAQAPDTLDTTHIYVYARPYGLTIVGGMRPD